MKRNSFSSLKLVAILLSMLMFTACDKNEFTAQDALDLELARLTAERAIEAEREAFTASEAANVRAYNKVVDSLRRVNAGGLVYYSVAVVPGGGSVFSGGRTEGLSGAKVTISQFGQNAAVTTDESGIASFPDLRSGEVNVSISIDGFTDMNYVSNLTPDGGVSNNASVYVGNVVPVFENVGTNPDNLKKMAFIKGRGFAELDITYGNVEEEIVPSGTTIASYIDVEGGIASPFWKKYINDANEEGSTQFNSVGLTANTHIKSGAIQRISYQEAGAVATYDAQGDYTLMVPATGSGLPTTMRYSEFAADRKYWVKDANEDGIQGAVVKRRFLYGPNVGQSAIATRGRTPKTTNSLPSFKLVKTKAGAATITLSNDGSIANTFYATGSVTSGLYLVPPTVTLTAAPAGGTNATATAVLGDKVGDAAPGDGFGSKLRPVTGISITNKGKGYTTAPTVTFKRQESGISGKVRRESADGKLGFEIVISDGGYGFTASSINTATTTTVGEWTGRDPLFNAPSGFTGGNPTLEFTYDFQIANAGGFDVVATANVSTGTATSQGTQWTSTFLTALNQNPFKYVAVDAVFPIRDVAGTDNLFISVAGSLQFNPLYGDANVGGINRPLINPTTLRLKAALPLLGLGTVGNNYSNGSGYVFVPQINLVQNGVAGSGAKLTATVNAAGEIIQLNLAGGSGYPTAANALDAMAVNVIVPANALAGKFRLHGSGIDAYEVIVDGSTGAAATYIKAAKGLAGSSFNDEYQTAAKKGDAHADGLSGLAASITTATNANSKEGNTFVAIADANLDPTGTVAYGYPIWNSSYSQVIGIELFDAGNGYQLAGQTFAWTLKPVFGNRTKEDATAATVTLTANKVTVTLASAGLGYATAPIMYVTGGGLNLGSAGALNSTDFDFYIDSKGTITKILFTGNASAYTVANVTADPLVGTISISESETALTSRFKTAINNSVTYDATTQGIKSWDLDNDYAGNVEKAFQDMIDGNSLGKTNVLAPVAFFTAPIPSMQDYKDAKSKAVVKNSFAVAPTLVMETPTGGTAATAAVTLNVDTGRIITLSVLTGGAGYRTYVNTNTENILIGGEGFKVLGGPDGNKNGAFEVYSGISYARDIHYGTGLELE